MSNKDHLRDMEALYRGFLLYGGDEPGELASLLEYILHLRYVVSIEDLTAAFQAFVDTTRLSVGLSDDALAFIDELDIHGGQ